MDWEELLVGDCRVEVENGRASRHFNYILGNPPFVGFSSGGKETPMVEGSRAAFGYPPKQASAAHSRSAASQNQTDSKWLFSDDGSKIAARHINGYLVDADDVWIESRTRPLCAVPEMTKGSSPVDGGAFFIDEEDYKRIRNDEPSTCCHIRKFLGAREFLHNESRYCLWLDKASPSEIRKSRFILSRVMAVESFRLSSAKAATRKFAEQPTMFMELRQPDTDYIVIPRHSSENRRYIPLGFETPLTICGDANNMVPHASLYHFGVLLSAVHMSWMRATAGRLKSDYRYSNDIVYNNFPWPRDLARVVDSSLRSVSGALDESELFKTRIERTAQAILDARALYPDSSLADLYDPLTMPPELRKAHATNDAAVMEAYGFAKTMTEAEIVAELFKRYAELTRR